MAFTLQDDSGTVDDANAYIDADFFLAYHADRGNSTSSFVVSSPSDLTDLLVSHYEMEEASGAQRNDSHGSNHLLDGGAAAVAQVAGHVGDFAAEFTGVTTKKLVVNALDAGNLNFTFTCWVRPLAHPGAGTLGIIFSKNANSDGNREYHLGINALGVPQWTVFDGTGTPQTTATSVSASESIGLTDWTFIRVWHDAVGDEIGIQVDDNDAVTAAHSTGVLDGGAQFAVGLFADNTWPFNGYVDSLSRWNRLLTAEGHAFLYDEGLGVDYPFGVLEPNSNIEKAIVVATDYLDHRFRFVGEKSRVDQRTQWPRISAEDANGDLRSGIPSEVKEACAEYAFVALSTGALNPTPTRDDSGVAVKLKREKVGPIEEETEFVESATYALPKYPVADQRLKASGLVIAGRQLRRA